MELLACQKKGDSSTMIAEASAAEAAVKKNEFSPVVSPEVSTYFRALG